MGGGAWWRKPFYGLRGGGEGGREGSARLAIFSTVVTSLQEFELQ